MARKRRQLIAGPQPVQPIEIDNFSSLFEDASLNRHATRGKTVAIKQIRLNLGQIEADYEVVGGRVATAGTMRLRVGRGDEELQKIITQLGDHLIALYKQLEKSP